jgi:hypothetical protein
MIYDGKVPPSEPDSLLLGVLQSENRLTMDDLVKRLPELRWNEVFHAIDRLSREGSITLTRDGFDYVVALPGIISQCA